MPMIVTVTIIYIFTYLPIQVFHLRERNNIGTFVFISHSVFINVLQVVVSEFCSFLRVIVSPYYTLYVLVISFFMDIGVVSTLGYYDQVFMAIYVQVSI